MPEATLVRTSEFRRRIPSVALTPHSLPFSVSTASVEMSIRLRRQSNGAARPEGAAESPPCVIVLHAKDARAGAGIVLGRSCSYSDLYENIRFLTNNHVLLILDSVISANRRISRRHARVTVNENGDWFIEECQNTNGVYVGRQRIHGRTHFQYLIT